MDRYVILRNEAAAVSAVPSGSTFGPRVSTIGPARPQPKIEVSDLSKKDLRDVARDGQVAAFGRVMPTELIRPCAVDADVAVNDVWGVGAVRADISSRTGDGVLVAVLDTGIDKDHPAFEGVEILEQDFTGTGNGDPHGHGTHCVGTILGRDVNGTRIGVARGVRQALIGKVLDSHGGGTSEMIFNAIQWAIQQGAHVVSMSLSIDFPGYVKHMESEGWPTELATSHALVDYRQNLRMFDKLMEMVKALASFGEGSLVVAAAGNQSRRDEDPRFEIAASLPAVALDVVSVGALERGANGLRIAAFSNTSPEIAAPGVGILSAKLGGGLIALSGTSMACPHVAGVACLWWEELRKSGDLPAVASLVRAKLLATARTSIFAPDVDVVDRGVGIVTAPL